MIQKFIIFNFLFSFSWAIGLQGLVIPQSGQILSTTGTGIAGDIDPALNPAMMKTDHPFMQFSLNNWLGDVSGSHTLFRWGNDIQKQVSIQSWSAKDLELWGDSPDERPLGSFGVHWASAAFSISHHFNTPYRFGLKIQTNYSRLFTESLSGITLDAGTVLPLGSSITAAAVIRNIGYEYTNNLRVELPLEGGIGLDIKLPGVKTSVLTDFLYSFDQGKEMRFAFATNWKYLNFNAGRSISDNRNAIAFGFSFNYRSWKINYGIYVHENSAVLGIPKFLDVRRYL
ncbi:MAG: hypothetical protein H8E85_00240 [Candidatus Marinimicrobia bacterium]|nr:hypothetical protein [Candidatus Neomarinimicrobiota bacterium]